MHESSAEWQPILGVASGTFRRFDPTLYGRPGVDAPFTGPKGITIGTPLSTLETTFTQDEWDSAGVFEGRFEIFAGDTTGATFDLDADERVSSMSAGYSCG